MKAPPSKLSDLKNAAEKALTCESLEEKAQALGEAYELFTYESSRMGEAYSDLKHELNKTSEKLEESNKRLKRKVRELDITTHYLKNILSNMAQGLIFVNLAGIITTCNRAAEQILEIDPTEILFQPFGICFKDDLFGFSMKRTLETRQIPRILPEFTHYDDSGEKHYIEVEARFVPKEKGIEPIEDPSRDASLDYTQGLIIFLRDVTEITILKRLADRNDRLKVLGEMAALVAHEIRNPLGGIKGFASLLAKDLADCPEQVEMANYILEGAESLNKLVTNVLNYARPIEPRFEQTDLIKLLKETIQSVKVDEALSKHITFKTHISPKECSLYVDGSLMKACLMNLMVNAIQAMDGKGILQIHSKFQNNALTIEIEDTGKGISKEELKKIFSPFFTTKSSGTGLGLSEALKVVQAHDGNIEVESTLEKGSLFTITLPRNLHYPPPTSLDKL